MGLNRIVNNRDCFDCRTSTQVNVYKLQRTDVERVQNKIWR